MIHGGQKLDITSIKWEAKKTQIGMRGMSNIVVSNVVDCVPGHRNRCFQWLTGLLDIVHSPESPLKVVEMLRDASFEFLSSDEYASLVEEYKEEGKRFLRLIAKYLEIVYFQLDVCTVTPMQPS